MSIHKVVVIGSGPAGWSAAIYAARANLKPVLFEGTPQPDMIPLGQLAFTTEVENYPGFPVGNVRAFIETAVDRARHYNLPPAPAGHVKAGQPHYAIQGVELVELMKQQAINVGTEVVSDDIVGLSVAGSPFQLQAGSGETIAARAVIVATGARANYLGLESEHEYKNRGVSACAVCDGALPRFRNKPLIVVGGGDSAVEEATYLAKFASKVHMVVRRDELRASKIMAQRALNEPKIEMVWNHEVDECLGDGTNGLTAVRLRHAQNGTKRTIEVGGMFLAIGHTPNTTFLQGKLATNEQGYLKLTVPFRTNTSIEGIFAAGDVADDYYRQAITSAGSGCMAALDAERWLAHQGH
ncbi:MAG TPA: FAD-dependent oxidoreductase [Pirellulales bacterium]|jgi:thioredoxin reductase (NADPH)|nr:FAD-dependent oxidoreductase [Pirellulales bacterium]